MILCLVDVKTLIILSCFLGLSSFTVATVPPQPLDLGLLANYYGDCPARSGPHAERLQSTIRQALRGDYTAMRLVIMHEGIFSTADNEGYSEVPQALLRTLGDTRYAAFITHQPRDVQQAALAVYPKQISAFKQRFPKTAKLYHEQFPR